MVRRPIGVITACVVAVLAGTSAVSAGAGGVDKYSFAGETDDGGSCGNSWAHDTYTLDVVVKKTGAGTYAVSFSYKNGSFTTFPGASPGACSSVSNHGLLVDGGIVGSFTGQLDETVTSATYNPNGCSSGCTSRTAVILGLFPGGTQDFSSFTYNFEYSSSDQTLVIRHWQDKSDKSGSDKFVGDIANS